MKQDCLTCSSNAAGLLKAFGKMVERTWGLFAAVLLESTARRSASWTDNACFAGISSSKVDLHMPSATHFMY